MRIPRITPLSIHPKHLHKMQKVHKKGIFVALNAAVLLGLAGTTAAYATMAKNVTVTLDGHTTTIRTLSDTVSGALATDGVTLGPNDHVRIGGRTASAASSVSSGDTVEVAFAKPVTVAVDGRAKELTVHDDTVGDVLHRLDVKPTPDAYVSEKLSGKLSRSGTRIVVSNPKSFVIEADGKTKKVTSAAPTVAAALKEADISLDDNDEVTPAAGDLIVGFSENVSLASGAFTLACTSSGNVALSHPSSGASFTISTGTALQGGESCVFTVVAGKVTDAGGAKPGRGAGSR